jgi:DNA-binding NtrC family response regulator
VWEAIQSFFAGAVPCRLAVSSRVPIIALVVSEQDRHVLASISSQEPLDVHFAGSCEEGQAVANQLSAPIILFDRNWPGTEWRPAVESLAAAPHRPCVILISGVADDYLFQELIRRGGYDVLPKPLRPDNAARVVKLALSYWNRSTKPAVPPRGRKK